MRMHCTFLITILFACSGNKEDAADNANKQDSSRNENGHLDHFSMSTESNLGESIVVLSKDLNEFELTPITETAFNNPDLKLSEFNFDDRSDIAPTFETETNTHDFGQAVQFTKEYIGTLPATGLHVYRFSGWEEGGYALLPNYPKSKYFIYNAQISEKLHVTQDSKYIFQNQEEMGYMYGVAVFRIINVKDSFIEDDWTIFNDLGFLPNMKIISLKEGPLNQKFIEVEVIESNETKKKYYELRLKAAPQQELLDTRDRSAYRTVKIGKHWITSDDILLESKLSDCDSCTKYSRLYQREIVTEICPEGWHIPSQQEWIEIFSKLNTGIDGGTVFYTYPLKNDGLNWKSSGALIRYSEDSVGYLGRGKSAFYWSALPDDGWGGIAIENLWMENGKYSYFSPFVPDSTYLAMCIKCIKDPDQALTSNLPYWLNH